VERGGCVYILTNKTHRSLYTGVTSDLYTRIYQHRNKTYPNSFTARYNIYILVYFEQFHSIEEAIAREKQIKAGSRKKKLNLIHNLNPNWNDLFDEVSQW
jgi:putative endonuclease